MQDMTGIYSGFQKFWQKPFDVEGDAWDWFLFVGLILIVIFLWTRILKEGGHVVSAVT